MTRAKEVELPPGCEIRDGRLVRAITINPDSDQSWEQLRPVAETLEEARRTRTDYYDRELGWIRGGFKLERDRSTESIMADKSISIAELAES